MLAFLPGQREIERTAERLAGRLPENCDVVPLYGNLDGKAQDAAIRPAPAGRRKVVLATSIAETSITIDGVRVVDRLRPVAPAALRAGHRHDAARDRARQRASADQRAGRAGRTQPGVAIRLWRAEQTAALPAFTPPEILRGRPLRPRCSTAPPSASPTRRRCASSIRRPAPALAEARALADRPRRDRRRGPHHRRRAKRCASSLCRCGWRTWWPRPRTQGRPKPPQSLPC